MSEADVTSGQTREFRSPAHELMLRTAGAAVAVVLCVIVLQTAALAGLITGGPINFAVAAILSAMFMGALRGATLVATANWLRLALVTAIQGVVLDVLLVGASTFVGPGWGGYGAVVQLASYAEGAPRALATLLLGALVIAVISALVLRTGVAINATIRTRTSHDIRRR